MFFFSKKLPENALWLDIFQLDNLIRQQVPFALIDVGGDSLWLENTPIRPTKSTSPKQAAEVAEQLAPDLQFPLVIIANKITKSVKASKVLAEQGYINIYVLETSTEDVRAFYKL